MVVVVEGRPQQGGSMGRVGPAGGRWGGAGGAGGAGRGSGGDGAGGIDQLAGHRGGVGTQLEVWHQCAVHA